MEIAGGVMRRVPPELVCRENDKWPEVMWVVVGRNKDWASSWEGGKVGGEGGGTRPLLPTSIS